MLTYVTGGGWGSGTGTPNSAAQVDANFYTLVQQIGDVVADVAEGKRISDVTTTTNSITFEFTDGSTQTIALPFAELHYIGAWANSTPLTAGQLFSVAGVGIYQVLVDHMTPASPAVFDPDAVTDDTDADPLYAFMLPVLDRLPVAGLTGEILRKSSDADYAVEWSALTADLVGFDPSTGSTLTSTNVADALEELAGGSGSLDGLTDVNVTEGPGINGYFLQWNDATSRWLAAASSTNLSGLADVNVTEGSGINGYFLKWDNGTSKWIAAASSSALSGLSDVNVTEGSGINGYFLKWSNGTSKWVASTIPLSGLSDVNITEGSGINGYFLKWDNATSKWVASLTGATAVSLSGLSDVNVSEGSGINNYFLKWDNGTSKWIAAGGPVEWAVACSDETTALTASTAKVTFRMPFAMTVTAVRASLVTAQTSGSIFTVDINESGTSIISTKLTIDNTEKTSTTAATPAVISDASLADDAEITIDIDQIGDGTAKGLKILLIGTRT